MFGPGSAPPDLCSIRAALEKEKSAEAVRGEFSAGDYPLGDNDPPRPRTSGIDHAIRLSTAMAVLAMAGIAAYVSYWHAYAVVRAHGETGITARLEPARIDGLVYASSMVVLYAARHRVPVPSLARWLLGLGIAATLTANMAQGWSHGLVRAVVAAWPAVSLVGSYELLVWMIRTSAAVERGPSAEHPCNRAPCLTALRCLPVSAVDGDRPGGS
jgi:nitrate reductase NapE component